MTKKRIIVLKKVLQMRNNIKSCFKYNYILKGRKKGFKQNKINLEMLSRKEYYQNMRFFFFRKIFIIKILKNLLEMVFIKL